jgi:hypothetical protein
VVIDVGASVVVDADWAAAEELKNARADVRTTALNIDRVMLCDCHKYCERSKV